MSGRRILMGVQGLGWVDDDEARYIRMTVPYELGRFQEDDEDEKIRTRRVKPDSA